MICDECPLQEGCIEQRGLCRDYIRYMERIERIRKQIEQLNEDQKTFTASAVPADKGDI